MRLQKRLLQLKRHNLPTLRTDWDVLDAGLFDLSCFVKVVRVETNLGVQQDNEFAFQKVERFFFCLAIVALCIITKSEFNGDLLRFGRVVVPVDEEFVLIHALEFFLISRDLGGGSCEDRVLDIVREAQLLVAAPMRAERSVFGTNCS